MRYTVLVAFSLICLFSCSGTDNKSSLKSTSRDELIQKFTNAFENEEIPIYSGLYEFSYIKDYPDCSFLYISQDHCLSCIDVLIEQISSCLQQRSCNIIYSVHNLNLFYSLKQTIKNSNTHVFLLKKNTLLQL